MKLGWILAATLVAACGQKDAVDPSAPADESDISVPADVEAEIPAAPERDYSSVAGYGDGWFVSAGWPGEYPVGFVVLDEGVVAPGRTRPNPSAPQDAACPLPRLANYHIWNEARTESDAIEYFVATRTFPVTLTQDAAIEYVNESGIQTLDLKAGDQLTYLRYLGEGFTVLSWQGQRYDINEAELRDITDINSSDHKEDLWLSVACTDGTRAWLKYDEVISLPGIAPSPIVGFGEASDLFADEVESVRSQAAEAAAEPSLEPPLE